MKQSFARKTVLGMDRHYVVSLYRSAAARNGHYQSHQPLYHTAQRSRIVSVSCCKGRCAMLDRLNPRTG